jgi:hypothetical protein
MDANVHRWRLTPSTRPTLLVGLTAPLRAVEQWPKIKFHALREHVIGVSVKNGEV